jgi:hypothetical protein
MRTSTGLTVTAVGAILLLAVHIPVPWLSLKIAGLIIMATGLAGLRIPQQVGGWLRHNQDRVMETFDPVSDADDTPRVPLDSLLDPSAAPGPVPSTGLGSVQSAGPGSVPAARPGPVPRAGGETLPGATEGGARRSSR